MGDPDLLACLPHAVECYRVVKHLQHCRGVVEGPLLGVKLLVSPSLAKLVTAMQASSPSDGALVTMAVESLNHQILSYLERMCCFRSGCDGSTVLLLSNTPMLERAMLGNLSDAFFSSSPAGPGRRGHHFNRRKMVHKFFGDVSDFVGVLGPDPPNEIPFGDGDSMRVMATMARPAPPTVPGGDAGTSSSRRLSVKARPAVCIVIPMKQFEGCCVLFGALQKFHFTTSGKCRAWSTV